MKHKGPAANARRLRFNQTEHQLRRNGRVDRGATFLQHPFRGVTGMRVRGNRHGGLVSRRLNLAKAARRFRNNKGIAGVGERAQT